MKEGTELLDKYQMGRVLGTGTFSTVRLARRKNDGALFAIKVQHDKIRSLYPRRDVATIPPLATPPPASALPSHPSPPTPTPLADTTFRH